MDEIPKSLELLESNLPKQIDGYALSQKSKMPWKVLLYREVQTLTGWPSGRIGVQLICILASFQRGGMSFEVSFHCTN